MMTSKGEPRILIARLSAIGDCILTLPLLCSLRQHWPNAFLAWVAEPAAASLLKGHPCLDRLIVVQRRWLKSPQAVWRLRQELRELRCQISIDPQGLSKSSIAARLSGAAQRIGFRGQRGREISTWLNNCLVEPSREHLVDAQLELLTELEIHSPKVEFRLPEEPTDAAAARELIRSAHLSGGFAIANPGAGWKSKLWPADRFGRVARHLGQRWNLPTLVTWAGPHEQELATRVAAKSGGHATIAPPTSLVLLAALSRRARVFIGSDTGPLHLAAAVGTPCIGLYGPTRWQQSGPYGTTHTSLQARYVEGTSRERRQADNSAMQEITVEEVCAACDQLVSRRFPDSRSTAAA